MLPINLPRVEARGSCSKCRFHASPNDATRGRCGAKSRGRREDLENNFRAVLRANLGKLDLAGREQFDAQRKVLERTRARLEELEKRVAALEAKSASAAN